MASTFAGRPRRTLTLAGVACAAGAYLVLSMDPKLNLYDEGLSAYGAWRVQAGDLPYLNFWTMYGPGGFYLNAWLFDLFGRSDLTLRVADTVSRVLIVVSSYALVSREEHASSLVAGLAAAAAALFLSGGPVFGSPVILALALALLSFQSLRRAWEGRGDFYVLAGLLCALCAAVRHDFGFCCAVASGVAMATRQWLTEGGTVAASVRSAVRPALLYAAGLLPVSLAIGAFLLVKVGSGPLYENLIEIPATIYPRVRRLPFPMRHEFLAALSGTRTSFLAFAVYIPFMVLALTGLTVWSRRSNNADARLGAGGPLIVLLAVFTALTTMKGLVRVSPGQMVQSIIPGLILLAILLNRAVDARERLLLACGGAVALLFALSTLPPTIRLMAANMGLRAAEPVTLASRCLQPDLPALRCVGLSPEVKSVVSFVASHTTPADAIYVGTGRHDRLFLNDVMIYFLAQRPAPTRWHDLHPGVQTRASTQREMVEAFTERRPALVILNREWDDFTEPSEQAVSSHVTLLDDYIRANFRPVASFGSFAILEPRI